MAFPTIESSAVSENAGSNTIDVPMPIGIVAGDLLLSLIIVDGGTVTVTASAGWDMPINVSGSQVTAAVCWKIAAGGDALTVTTGASRNKGAITYRISGHGNSAVITPAFAVTAETFSVSPAPPALSPSWGAADTLWVAGFAMDDSSRGLLAYPANYTIAQQLHDADVGSSASFGAMAARQLNVASETPGDFSVNSADRWIAFTCGIKPAGGSARARAPLMLTPW